MAKKKKEEVVENTTKDNVTKVDLNKNKTKEELHVDWTMTQMKQMQGTTQHLHSTCLCASKKSRRLLMQC